MNIEEIDLNDIDGDNRKTIDFDNILEQRIKLGKTQIMSFISCAILWLADGAEMFVVGFILPVIQAQWSLKDWEINILGSVVFISWATGAIFIGQLADKIGRRKPMLYGAAGQFVSAVLSAFSPNFFLLILLRGVFGFFLGLTAPISVTNFSETFPKNNRGRYFTAASSFFILGELVTILMAYFCLDSTTRGNWRLLLLWSSLPGFIALIFIYTSMQESPRYLLLCTNQYEKAFAAIDIMIKNNHSSNMYEALRIKDYEEKQVLKWVEEQKASITPQNPQKQGVASNKKGFIQSYKQLFKSEYKSTTFKLMIMWFSLSLVYYGIMYILPTTLIKMHATDKYKDKVTEKHEDFEEDHQDFLGIASTILVEIPAALFVIAMIEYKKMGRKNFMTVSYGLCGLFCLCTFFSTTPNSLFFFFVSGSKVFIGFCFAVIYPFTAEIYSTNIRAAGCGLNNSICRLGGALMPFLSFIAFFISNTGPFLIYFLACMMSLIASYKLSVDTTNMELDKFTEKRREVKIKKQQKFMEKLDDNPNNNNNNNNNKEEENTNQAGIAISKQSSEQFMIQSNNKENINYDNNNDNEYQANNNNFNSNNVQNENENKELQQQQQDNMQQRQLQQDNEQEQEQVVNISDNIEQDNSNEGQNQNQDQDDDIVIDDDGNSDDQEQKL